MFWCLSCSLPEGASEEPGDEGADGSDEEPAVGRQRHVDAEEMTVIFFIFLLFFEKEFFKEDDNVQVKRTILDLKPEATHNAAGTSGQGPSQL